MASASEHQTEVVPACFFLMEDIDKSLKGYHICVALQEAVAGEGGIDGGGDLKGVFRIYCKKRRLRCLKVPSKCPKWLTDL